MTKHGYEPTPGEHVTEAHEMENAFETEIVVLAPNGFGFGEGKISTKTQLENPEVSNLTHEALDTGLEIIQDGVPFKEVDKDAQDDGCGDGRWTKIVYKLKDRVTGLKEKFNKSRLRAKIFGGGLVTASSMFRSAIPGTVDEASTVLDDREYVAGLLQEAGIEHGGHTDDHEHPDGSSGCGAIDKYPLITANAVKFRKEITNVLKTVYGDEYAARESAIGEVFSSYEDQVKHSDTYFQDAEGNKTIELMERNGSVIKQLADEHLEDFVVINDVEGTTFDQRAFDEEMKERGIKGTAQAFVIDAWRGRMYADFIAKIAQEEHKIDYKEAYNRAEADFWIRSLAVSATLTAGDLPVVLRRHAASAAVA